MAKKPDELKGDKFTLYITPKGKAGNLPNMVILHNNSGKQVGSLTMSQIMPFVMENSTILAKLTKEELEEWKSYYQK
jgi:hypothetical protein